MLTYKNPYLNRVMIRDIKDFYGRRKQVARIFSRIGATRPQSISVVGQRRIGKSSLLNFICHRDNRQRYLENPDEYVFLFMDLQERRDIDPSDFFRSLFKLLSDETKGRVAIEENPDYNGLKEVLLKLQRENIKLIVIFDEFDSITKNQNFQADFFAFLRSIANNYDVAYITSSGRDLQELCHTQKIADSPFFNIFFNLYLRVFEEEEAIELIENPSAESGIPLRDYADFILDIAGLFPLFIQIACSVLFDYLLGNGEEIDRDEVKELYLDEVRVHFQYIWEQFTKDQKNVCYDVACGEVIEDKRRYILRDLEKEGFIFEDSGEYRLFSSVFRDYIQEIGIRERPGGLKRKKKKREERSKTPRVTESEQEVIYPEEEAKRECKFGIIGKSERMREVFRRLEKVIPTSATVMITGESGTGKELIARAIHDNGERKDKKFVAQNCAALPETLLESELFGHTKGAFTDAVNEKKGLFEVADGGTIFLDEITDASPAIQAKLLRVLQEKEIQRIGETETRKVDVRVISATNKDLEIEIQEGRFRKDLYFRLNVILINMPPLRERREDIPLLTAHFLTEYGKEMKKPLKGFTEAAMDLLVEHSWPGNVRELQNAVQSAIVMVGDGEIILPEHLQLSSEVRHDEGKRGASLPDIEKAEIEQALKECGWNQTKAATLLGISRDKLRHRIKKYKIKGPWRIGSPSTIGE